ncbi:DUF92 domain-containing protein [Haladaptatus sp. F3-133]|uniref:DUF92 domain-containing protein n=1 Tax=Halorutilus salinus TaxID=2487751 RepID=A0A9Q4C5V3_9EURY|nr:DUF92 domain-containing protein [Halorutilus salinus]MCX2819647.1 DUF92 domain-containing protein [Halorutilus salinus]
MNSRIPAVAVLVACLVFLFGSESYTASFILLALGATETDAGYDDRHRVAAVTVAVVAVLAVTAVSDISDAVAVSAVTAVAVGEAVTYPSGGKRSVDSFTAPFYILGGGGAGAVAGFAAGMDAAVGVTVGFFAALTTVTARSLGTSLWLTVVVASVGAWAGSVVGATASAPVLVVAVVGVAGLAGGANLADLMTVSGASAGALLSYVVLVAGGVGWFVVLGTFVVTGAVTTAYGRDEKTEMGLAEHTEGRGFENVAANGVVALTSAIVYAAETDPTIEIAAGFAFVGCMATAAADTASSEIGTVAGEPRLVTTLERVPPGTDGGVSWQGEVVTVVAVAVVGATAYLAGVVPVSGAVAGAFAGLVGAHVDSVLGATVEGRYLGNSGVNLSACTTGALVASSFVLF